MKKVQRLIITALVVICILFALQRLFMPKYMSKIIEGSLIESYYEAKEPHDVLFVGDCEVYENFSPIVLYQDYGISSFIRGSAQQLIWHSYYLLEEMLAYEKPKVVIFNVLSMKYDEPQKETYNRMSIDGMKWSKYKVSNIKASMMEDEKFLDYVFPLFRFHSRFSDLNNDDFKYYFKKEDLFHNGYYMRCDTLPLRDLPRPPILQKKDFSPNVYEYLDKMHEICKANGAELILIKAPTVYPHWYKEWDEAMIRYSQKNNLRYINFLNEDLIREIGIDFSTDTYDSGLHLNLSGAEKLSHYLGKYLKSNFEIVDRRNTEDAKIWEVKVEKYNNYKARQYDEIAKYGKIKMYD